MTFPDVAPVTALVLAGGWADFGLVFAFAVQSPASLAMVAEVAGAPVGVGIGTRNGTTGWLGPIYTTPAMRGQGVGRMLTNAVADGLEAAGCESLLLAATELGKPVYGRLGFVAEGRYHVFQGQASALQNDGPAVRLAQASDMDAIRAMDRWASGEDRTHLLDAFGPPYWVVDDASSGRVKGFALATPWGAGAVIAADPVDGLALLHHTATIADDGSIMAVLPGENARGRSDLVRLGFREVRSLPRMQRGRAVDWQPATIWRLFSFGKG